MNNNNIIIINADLDKNFKEKTKLNFDFNRLNAVTHKSTIVYSILFKNHLFYGISLIFFVYMGPEHSRSCKKI